MNKKLLLSAFIFFFGFGGDGLQAGDPKRLAAYALRTVQCPGGLYYAYSVVCGQSGRGYDEDKVEENFVIMRDVCQSALNSRLCKFRGGGDNVGAAVFVQLDKPLFLQGLYEPLLELLDRSPVTSQSMAALLLFTELVLAMDDCAKGATVECRGFEGLLDYPPNEFKRSFSVEQVLEYERVIKWLLALHNSLEVARTSPLPAPSLDEQREQMLEAARRIPLPAPCLDEQLECRFVDWLDGARRRDDAYGCDRCLGTGMELGTYGLLCRLPGCPFASLAQGLGCDFCATKRLTGCSNCRRYRELMDAFDVACSRSLRVLSDDPDNPGFIGGESDEEEAPDLHEFSQAWNRQRAIEVAQAQAAQIAAQARALAMSGPSGACAAAGSGASASSASGSQASGAEPAGFPPEAREKTFCGYCGSKLNGGNCRDPRCSPEECDGPECCQLCGNGLEGGRCSKNCRAPGPNPAGPLSPPASSAPGQAPGSQAESGAPVPQQPKVSVCIFCKFVVDETSHDFNDCQFKAAMAESSGKPYGNPNPPPLPQPAPSSPTPSAPKRDTKFVCGICWYVFNGSHDFEECRMKKALAESLGQQYGNPDPEARSTKKCPSCKTLVNAAHDMEACAQMGGSAAPASNPGGASAPSAPPAPPAATQNQVRKCQYCEQIVSDRNHQCPEKLRADQAAAAAFSSVEPKRCEDCGETCNQHGNCINIAGCVLAQALAVSMSEGTEGGGGASAESSGLPEGAGAVPSTPPAAGCQAGSGAMERCEECGWQNDQHNPDCMLGQALRASNASGGASGSVSSSRTSGHGGTVQKCPCGSTLGSNGICLNFLCTQGQSATSSDVVMETRCQGCGGYQNDDGSYSCGAKSFKGDGCRDEDPSLWEVGPSSGSSSSSSSPPASSAPAGQPGPQIGLRAGQCVFVPAALPAEPFESSCDCPDARVTYFGQCEECFGSMNPECRLATVPMTALPPDSVIFGDSDAERMARAAFQSAMDQSGKKDFPDLVTKHRCSRFKEHMERAKRVIEIGSKFSEHPELKAAALGAVGDVAIARATGFDVAATNVVLASGVGNLQTRADAVEMLTKMPTQTVLVYVVSAAQAPVVSARQKSQAPSAQAPLAIEAPSGVVVGSTSGVQGSRCDALQGGREADDGLVRSSSVVACEHCGADLFATGQCMAQCEENNAGSASLPSNALDSPGSDLPPPSPRLTPSPAPVAPSVSAAEEKRCETCKARLTEDDRCTGKCSDKQAVASAEPEVLNQLPVSRDGLKEGLERQMATRALKIADEKYKDPKARKKLIAIAKAKLNNPKIAEDTTGAVVNFRSSVLKALNNDKNGESRFTVAMALVALDAYSRTDGWNVSAIFVNKGVLDKLISMKKADADKQAAQAQRRSLPAPLLLSSLTPPAFSAGGQTTLSDWRCRSCKGPVDYFHKCESGCDSTSELGQPTLSPGSATGASAAAGSGEVAGCFACGGPLNDDNGLCLWKCPGSTGPSTPNIFESATGESTSSPLGHRGLQRFTASEPMAGAPPARPAPLIMPSAPSLPIMSPQQAATLFAGQGSGLHTLGAPAIPVDGQARPSAPTVGGAPGDFSEEQGLATASGGGLASDGDSCLTDKIDAMFDWVRECSEDFEAGNDVSQELKDLRSKFDEIQSEVDGLEDPFVKNGFEDDIGQLELKISELEVQVALKVSEEPDGAPAEEGGDDSGGAPEDDEYDGYGGGDEAVDFEPEPEVVEPQFSQEDFDAKEKHIRELAEMAVLLEDGPEAKRDVLAQARGLLNALSERVENLDDGELKSSLKPKVDVLRASMQPLEG